MLSLKKLLSERSDYQIYHNQYSYAVEAALEYATEQGWEYNQKEVSDKVGLGPKKPSPGKTNRFSIELTKTTKDGKTKKSQLHFQIYGTPNRNYELNTYIG